MTANPKLDESKRQKMMSQILQSEIEMLQNINKKKFIIHKKQKKENVETMLKKLAAARRWLNSHNRYNLVITPDSRRAEELLQLYHDLDKFPLNEVN